ncbi:hypothetical protein [Chlorogloeopsis sp. ULAP02]|uniref:hypothetical protein n=1 Tax=Chlorogloeopsis sp. ULAP02 TaxID=3107926 RepID=UPI003135A74E
MFSLDALFCHVDDFCKAFESQWYKKLFRHGVRRRIRASQPVPDFLSNLFGKIFAECAQCKLRECDYVSQKLANQLLEDFGIQFFALTSFSTLLSQYFMPCLPKHYSHLTIVL